MDWVREFYQRQGALSDAYRGGVADHHRLKASQIASLAGTGPKKILELGAGGGQNAAATAELGHSVVAIELVPAAAEHARSLSSSAAQLSVICGDFYAIDPGSGFDIVCYWDGFGVGEDTDQRLLLERIAQWLRPGGHALIDIYTPWYAASTVGKGWAVGDAWREYGFDAEGCRWLDTWKRSADAADGVTQSLRCYSPADLRLLLEGTPMALQSVHPGPGPSRIDGKWGNHVDLDCALSYTAVIRHRESNA